MVTGITHNVITILSVDVIDCDKGVNISFTDISHSNVQSLCLTKGTFDLYFLSFFI